MIHALLLGNAQDAGLPQAGCGCENCTAAHAAGERQLACALGLIDSEAGLYFLIDATPDFREQLHLLQMAAGRARMGGILITHAHMGHYTGLLHLGYEAMSARETPLYGTERFLGFMRENAPWKQLFGHGNLAPRPIQPGEWTRLTPALDVQAILVPHRDEWSDTVAYKVRGPARSLLYLPDIDAWEKWSLNVRDEVADCAVALLDGSFFSPEELPGRDLSKIGHPLAPDTVARLKGAPADVRLIHLNHSNPLHRAGPERAWLEAQGVSVGRTGDRWVL